MSSIPQRSRDLVKSRERFRCCRCGCPAPAGHLHHRRGRSVVDQHTHCPCCLILLCHTCHTWVHAHPVDARKGGFMLSRFTDEPGTIPVDTVWGRRHHHCTGTFTFTKEQP